MIAWVKTVAIALGVIFIAAVASVIPPLPSLFAWVDAHQTQLSIATGFLAVVGLMLMMGGIIDLIMSQDRSLTHGEAEDVERSVRMTAQPQATAVPLSTAGRPELTSVKESPPSLW